MKFLRLARWGGFGRLGELIQIAENNNIHKSLPENTLVNYVDIDAIDNKNYCIKNVKQIPVKISRLVREGCFKRALLFILSCVRI